MIDHALILTPIAARDNLTPPDDCGILSRDV
jgi:hypothetical protein